MQTHYDILEVPSSASNDQIKAAFRRLAKLYHPDKNPTGKDQFEKILLAYEILSDSSKRRQYDLRLKGFSTSSTSKTSSQNTKQKQWSFTDEELKRRQYYQENYRKEYNKYAKTQAASGNKKAYNEYKYILFATPLAVALFMLVIRGFESTKSTSKKEVIEEKITQEIKMGSDPFTAYFKNPVFDSVANRNLILKNVGNKDIVVSLFNKENKFLRSCVIKVGFFAELEKLPDNIKTIRILTGKNWNSSKSYKDLNVIGGFEDEIGFYNIDVSKTNGWTISIDEDLLNASEKIDEKQYFKSN